MKVLLVGNYVLDRQYSMLGFADCLMRELPTNGIAPTLIAPTAKLGQMGKTARSRKWLAYADKYLLFPKLLREAVKAHDLIHVLDHGNAMYVPHLPSESHLITCHDLLAMRAADGEIHGWEVGPSGRKYQDLIKKGLKKSNLIACVSEATLEDVSRIIGHAPDRLKLIYNGQYQVLQRISEDQLSRIRSKFRLPDRFLLHVGGDSIYKNRHGLIDIHLHLYRQLGSNCPSLILAGRPLPEDVSRQIENDLPGLVKVIDSPSREDLSALYQLATALVFPSTHEGFGLPILEAQSLGCPVFTSDRVPMKEVGGSAAVYFDPDNAAVAADVIAQNLERLQPMAALGLENSKSFSTQKMIDDYAQLYREIKS